MTLTPDRPNLDPSDRFDQLVHQVERFAHQHPQRYQQRLRLLVWVGYAYIGVVLGGLALLLFAFVQPAYALLVLLGLGSLVWIRTPPPKGVACDLTQFPALFAELDDLSARLHTPTIDRVVLTADLNAAVLQAPKFGLFGWYTNYLILGLPLMQTVSPEQFRATLAHELGHLSGNHSRFAGWIYRIRRAWLMLSSQQGQRPSVLMVPFFKWYEPFFRAYSFVLSRSHEYVADRCAAECTTPTIAAQDLMQIYIQSYQVREIWQDLLKQANQQATPPDDALSQVLARLSQTIAPEQTQTWLELALAQQTNNDDTHPCLRDRLAAYGYSPSDAQQAIRASQSLAPAETAADRYLGTAKSQTIRRLDALWQQEMQPLWQRQHRRAQLRHAFWQQLSALAQQQPLTVEQSLKLANLTAEFEGCAAALPLLRTLQQRAPHQAMVNFYLGEALLDQAQSSGLEHLTSAIQQDPSLLISAFEPLYTGLLRQGQANSAAHWLAQFRQLHPQWQKAQTERETWASPLTLAPHELPTAEVQQLVWHLTRFPETRAAFLAKRQVKHLPETPCYVLALMAQSDRANLMQSLSGPELVEIVQQTLCLSADVRVVLLDQQERRLFDALRSVPNAKIV
jgi:Zn-dependent protease with chaperone function